MVSTVGVTILTIVITVGCSAAPDIKSLETNDINNYHFGNSINLIFDLILRRYTEKLIETGKTNVQIPGFQRIFSTKILSMYIEGGALVNDGWCGNLSTLHRTGDAEIDRIDDDMILTAHLGLRELKMDYNNYDISFLDVHQKGMIHINIGENSVWVKVRVQLVPKCVITLTNMKIEKLDDIDVDISHLGIFEGMTDDITSWVVNEVTRWYKSYVEHTVYPEIAKIVKNTDLCHYLPISNINM